MEYSVEDAIFCYRCRHFATNSGCSEKSFTQTGFRDWKHALGKHGNMVHHGGHHEGKESNNKENFSALKRIKMYLRPHE